jgi:hypothetical protein
LDNGLARFTSSKMVMPISALLFPRHNHQLLAIQY